MNSHLLLALPVGLGATALLDLANWTRARLFGVPAPGYEMVGRWVAHMPAGTFRHASIAKASPHPAETLLGWGLHYAIGVAFAAVLLAATGPDWAAAPTPGPALLTGALTVAMPFLVMQPAFGLGIAASATPAPWSARRRSLVNHLIFGCALYVAALACAAI